MRDRTLADSMKDARIARRISQAKAAEEIRISVATYNRAEGTARMSYATARAVERWMRSRRRKRPRSRKAGTRRKR
jgi:transcriptional regulator with XRE-family HTH domain